MMTNNDYEQELDLCRTAAAHGYRLVKMDSDDLGRLELSSSTVVYALAETSRATAGVINPLRHSGR
ncbi:hypothetical protein [Mycolicibacterium sp. 120270]|uniref:hypothetical protein n=1 Tax=Mycolicibacterium sp. 120270 TaxID=3090600 RepID=UPI00299D7DDD|nr:hypothetical protein [Mycolicibacterium sp. 120270]MDX1886529.1 hypothetical protein [Mycolicibacterium sp. 120270]